MEVSTIDLGRDVRKLKQISLDTGLTIVASTRFLFNPVSSGMAGVGQRRSDCGSVCRELTEGIDDTGIKAGIIAEIASSPERFEGEEKKILKAAGIASRQTGAAVSTHTGRATAVETIETLLAEGMDPDKIIIGHQDLIDDTKYHVQLLKYGVNIAFDTCGKKPICRMKRGPAMRWRSWKPAMAIICFSATISPAGLIFTSQGGDGYLSVMKWVIPLLKQIGASDRQIQRCLVDNPARILDNEWR